MRLMDCEYARPVPALPADLAKKLGSVGPGGLDEHEDEIYKNVLGMLPGWPEAFASNAARDAALGEYGPFVTFVPTNFAEFQMAGFPISRIAIGHQLSDPDFYKVAPPVLDAMVETMENEGEGSVIIGRVQYVIRDFGGDVGVGALPEFDVRADPDAVTQTMQWLEANYADVLRRKLAAQA